MLAKVNGCGRSFILFALGKLASIVAMTTSSTAKPFGELFNEAIRLLRDFRFALLRGIVVSSVLLVIANIPQMYFTGSMDLPVYKELETTVAQTLFYQQNPWYGPAALSGIFLLLAVSIASVLYFMVVLARREKNEGKAFKEGLALIGSLFMVMIWAFLYSYIWVGYLVLLASIAFIVTKQLVLGAVVLAIGIGLTILLTIIKGPRFVLAQIIRVQEQVSAREAVRLSYRRTAGYWGKIVGNMLLIGLIIFGCALAGMIVAVIVSIFSSPYVALVVPIILQQVFAPAQMSFLVVLTETITKHPRAKV